ncbi:MAG: NTP transferase domain-containing protein [Planctomycetota bacterium]
MSGDAGKSSGTDGGRGLSAVILAAGKGTRMQSDLPKVCHPVGGRPMVCAVVDACFAAGCSRVVVVVGYQHEKVRDAVASGDPAGAVEFAMQEEQLGTGHAVRCAASAFDGVADEDAFVLCGDGPLIRSETLALMLDRHRSTGATATLATATLDDPSGYGRVVRGVGGGFERIVEQKNATDAELGINEVNPSYYCFDSSRLFSALERVEKNELTGEYYVTDVPALLLADGDRVEVIDAVPAEDVLSINTPEHLAEVDRLYRERVGGVGASAEGGAR